MPTQLIRQHTLTHSETQQNTHYNRAQLSYGGSSYPFCFSDFSPYFLFTCCLHFSNVISIFMHSNDTKLDNSYEKQEQKITSREQNDEEMNLSVSHKTSNADQGRDQEQKNLTFLALATHKNSFLT